VNLNQKQVVAPIDGIVGDFSIKAGDYVSVGQPDYQKMTRWICAFQCRPTTGQLRQDCL